jgi:hypothetical protein
MSQQGGICLALAFSMLSVAGCSDSIFRMKDLDGDQIVVTDAKQRVILSQNGKRDALTIGRIEPSRIVCPEPSPDVAQALSVAINASLQGAMTSGKSTSDFAGQVGVASAQSIAQLGERLATIQLLRDELADLCRSWANGAVSTTTYTLRLSRLDKKMVTLLLAETSAGAFGRTLVGINGSAVAGSLQAANTEELNNARAELLAAGTQLETAEEELKKVANSNDPADKEKKRQDVEKARKTLSEKNDKLFALERIQAHNTAGGTLVSVPGAITNRAQTIPPEFATIQQQFLEHDELGTFLDACFTAMDVRNRRDPERLRDLRNEIEILEGRLRDYVEIQSKTDKAKLPADYDIATRNVARTQSELDLANRVFTSPDDDPLSPLGIYCNANLHTLQQLIGSQLSSRQSTFIQRRIEAEATLKNTILKTCAPVLESKDPATSQDLKKYCRLAIAPKEDAPTPESPDQSQTPKTDPKRGSDQLPKADPKAGAGQQPTKPDPKGSPDQPLPPAKADPKAGAD